MDSVPVSIAMKVFYEFSRITVKTKIPAITPELDRRFYIPDKYSVQLCQCAQEMPTPSHPVIKDGSARIVDAGIAARQEGTIIKVIKKPDSPPSRRIRS